MSTWYYSLFNTLYVNIEYIDRGVAKKKSASYCQSNQGKKKNQNYGIVRIYMHNDHIICKTHSHPIIEISENIGEFQKWNYITGF